MNRNTKQSKIQQRKTARALRRLARKAPDFFAYRDAIAAVLKHMEPRA